MRKNLITILILILVLSVVLVGCNDSDKAESEESDISLVNNDSDKAESEDDAITEDDALTGEDVILYYAEYECYYDDERAVTDEDFVSVMDNLKNILLGNGYAEVKTEKVTEANNSYIRVEVADREGTESLMELIGDPSTLTFGDADGNIEMTGTGMIDSCVLIVDPNNSGYYALSFQFNKEGTTQFATLTEKYKDDFLYIYIDGNKLMNPKVNEVISNGKTIITGNFDYETAYRYQVKLQAGNTEVKLRLIMKGRLE